MDLLINRAAARRLWGLRVSLLVAIATTLSIAVPQVQARQREVGFAGLAAEHRLSTEQLSKVVLSVADPQLDEAVRNGVITERERRKLRERIRLTGTI